MSYKVSLLAALLLFSSIITAQTLTIEGVERPWLINYSPVMQSGEVVGYYFFYRVKKERKKHTYKLKIYDSELQPLSESDIVSMRSLKLSGAAFDGQRLMFTFYNYAQYAVEYMIFTPQGELLAKHVRNIPNYIYRGEFTNSAEGFHRLFDVPGGGFVVYQRIQNRQAGYTIERFDSEGTSLWEYISPTNSEMDEVARFFSVEAQMLLSFLSTVSWETGRTERYFIHALHTETGEQLFEVEIKNKDYDITLFTSKFDDVNKDVLVFGEYYPRGEGDSNPLSQGLFAARVNLNGEMSDEKYISWEKEVSQFLPVGEGGKQKGEGYTWFHQIVKGEDGRYFAIGERYKRVVKAGSIALLALDLASAVMTGETSGASELPMTKTVVKDIVIYEFSPEFELEDIKVIPQEPIGVTFSDNGRMPVRALGLHLSNRRIFGYYCTQEEKDGNHFSMIFIKKKPMQNARDFTLFREQDDGYRKYPPLLRTSNQVGYRKIHPAKPGYVMVSGYNKRKRQIIGSLEKIEE